MAWLAVVLEEFRSGTVFFRLPSPVPSTFRFPLADFIAERRTRFHGWVSIWDIYIIDVRTYGYVRFPIFRSCPSGANELKTECPRLLSYPPVPWPGAPVRRALGMIFGLGMFVRPVSTFAVCCLLVCSTRCANRTGADDGKMFTIINSRLSFFLPIASAPRHLLVGRFSFIGFRLFLGTAEASRGKQANRARSNILLRRMRLSR